MLREPEVSTLLIKVIQKLEFYWELSTNIYKLEWVHWFDIKYSINLIAWQKKQNHRYYVIENN